MKIDLKLSPAGYFPAVILILTILLLIIILASLSRQTLDREEKLLMDLKEAQARTMVRSIASASRLSIMMGESGWHLDRFIADTVQNENLAFIALYEGLSGTLISSPGFKPDEYGLVLSEVRRRLSDKDYVSSVETFRGVGRIFLHVARFHPLDSPWVHLRMLEIPTIPGVIEKPSREDEDVVSYVVIGMTTNDLDEAVSKGRRQALLSGFLLLLLGTVGFYFLILVQGYYSARRALADFRQYTLDVIQGMAQGFINIDNQGILRTINPEAEAILGIKSRDYIGKNWSELFPQDTWGEMADLLESRDVSYDMEIEPSLPDKPHLKVTLIPVMGQSGTGGKVLFLRDLGEVKGLQAEIRRTERLAALGRLIAGMAHEIRNPLNSISGYSQHLRRKFSPDSSEGKAVDVIVREVDRLNRVITDLLDFSRPREPKEEILDLNDVIRSTRALVEREASGKGITIVTEMEEKGVSLAGDSDSLKQLLLNLFLNSFQAMPDGGILNIRTGILNQQPYISVSDTGRGIAESDQEKIFEPFFTTREKGTGLGLATVHRIVLDHGGDIRVESTPGSGTTFTVRFPRIGTV